MRGRWLDKRRPGSGWGPPVRKLSASISLKVLVVTPCAARCFWYASSLIHTLCAREYESTSAGCEHGARGRLCRSEISSRDVLLQAFLGAEGPLSALRRGPLVSLARKEVVRCATRGAEPLALATEASTKFRLPLRRHALWTAKKSAWHVTNGRRAGEETNTPHASMTCVRGLTCVEKRGGHGCKHVLQEK